MLTFEQWQATGRAVDDVEAATGNAGMWEGMGAGRIYAGDLVIIAFDDGEGFKGWELIIGNSDTVSPDLAALELELYDYYRAERA